MNKSGTGPAGRSKASGDYSDYYKTTLAANQTITLTIAETQQAGILDLDLYLYDLSGNIVDASLGTTETSESLTVIQQGTYLVEIYAYSGASNYILSTGISASSASAARLRLSDDFVPGQVIVRFKDTILPAGGNGSLSARAQSVGLLSKAGASGREMLFGLGNEANIKRAFNTLGISQRLNASVPEEQLKLDTLMAIKSLRKRADVTWAEPNYIRHAYALPNDEFYPYQWHYPLIHLPQAWDITTGSSNTIIAVIDTGVLLSHPDLTGQLIAGYDFISDTSISLDGDGIDNDPDECSE